MLLGRSVCPSWHQMSGAERPAWLTYSHSAFSPRGGLARRSAQSHIGHYYLRTTKRSGEGKDRNFVYLKQLGDLGCLQSILPSKESLQSPALFCMFNEGLRDAVSILELGWGGKDVYSCLGRKMDVHSPGTCPRSDRARHHPGHLGAD